MSRVSAVRTGGTRVGAIGRALCALLLLLAALAASSRAGTQSPRGDRASEQSTIQELGQHGDWKLILQKYTPPQEPPVPLVSHGFVQKHIVDRTKLGRHSVSRPESYTDSSKPEVKDPLAIWVHFEAPFYRGLDKKWVAELRLRFLEERNQFYAVPVKPPFDEIRVQIRPLPFETGRPSRSAGRAHHKVLPIEGEEVVVLLDQSQARFVADKASIELVGKDGGTNLTLWTGEGLGAGMNELGWDALATFTAGQGAAEELERAASGAPTRPQDVPERTGLAKEFSAQECFERGARLYEGKGVQEDHAEALLWLTWAARQNHSGAQYYLGRMFQAGHWVEQDPAEAYRWYLLSAEQGLAQSQFVVAKMLWQGNGTEKNQGLTATWLKRSAEQGFAPAATDLAVLYFQGQGGLTADPGQAVVWWRKAAEAGYAEGQYSLGAAYAMGVGGLSKDYAQATSWLRKAAAQGHAKAAEALKQIRP